MPLKLSDLLAASGSVTRPVSKRWWRRHGAGYSLGLRDGIIAGIVLGAIVGGLFASAVYVERGYEPQPEAVR